MASNAFVIHGDHTDTGMPIFENDPHLANQLPSQFILQHMRLPDGRAFHGAATPGFPFVLSGRTPNIAFGVTASRVDTSDLWEETLNEDGTKYLVDGEWRDLEISEKIIKVKFGEDRVLPVRKTHRGVLVSFELLKNNCALLFGGKAPDVPLVDKYYSFAW